MPKHKSRRRSRGLSGATRTCIEWTHVRTDRGREMRCAAYGPPGCPTAAGHKKGFSYCPVASGSKAGRRYRSSAHYPIRRAGR